MPMMNMMWGGWSSPFGGTNSTNNMMSFGFGPFGGFGWIFMILWWVLIIAGIVALIKWLTSQSRGNGMREKSALDILKERYARGEMDRKEFEDKKKDLI
jgi:putative membrane protein